MKCCSRRSSCGQPLPDDRAPCRNPGRRRTRWVGALTVGGTVAVMDTASLTALVDELAGVLAECGLHAGLRFLNARTRHRFTGVYRFDPPMLRNLCLFDRENPTLRFGGDTPMRETYCSLVGAQASPFATPDAEADGRLLDHPARLSV